MRPLAAEAYARLKAATRKLVRDAGGCEYAETRVGKTKLAEYGAPNMPDRFAPVDVIADLERSVGEPLVTRELAAQAGYDLVPAGQAAVPLKRLETYLLDLMGQLGALSREIAAAEADGQLDAAEIERIRLAAQTLKIEIDRTYDAICRMQVERRGGLRAVG